MASSSWRVLLAEDNPTNQRVALFMLKSLGCDIEIVGDGAQALAAWRDGQFDIVLMDCQMPVMDGFEATRAIRTAEGRGAHIPIVALTANAMDGDRERCLTVGMDEYVAKPLTKATLSAALDRLVTTGLLPQRCTDGPRVA